MIKDKSKTSSGGLTSQALFDGIASVTARLKQVRDEVDAVHRSIVDTEADEASERRCAEASILIHTAATKLASILKVKAPAFNYAEVMRVDPRYMLAHPADLPADVFVEEDKPADTTE